MVGNLSVHIGKENRRTPNHNTQTNKQNSSIQTEPAGKLETKPKAGPESCKPNLNQK